MERAGALLLLAALGLPALAGCVGDEEPAPLAPEAFLVGRRAMEEDGVYAFRHEGGALGFGAQGGDLVTFDLFDPADKRLGRVEVGPSAVQEDVRLDGMAAGDYVVHVQRQNGTLLVRSGDRPVSSFLPLGLHYERHVLAEAPMPADPLLGFGSDLFGGGEDVRKTSEVALLRTPLRMQILVAGRAENLELTVDGPAGIALQISTAYNTRQGSEGAALDALNSAARDQALRGAHYTARVDAQGLEGVVLLEAWTYSRHEPSQQAVATRAEGPVAFTYGELPGQPVAVTVHEGATALYAWTEAFAPDRDNGTGEPSSDANTSDVAAWFAIYDPDDVRLGTYKVRPGEILRIPVDEGGEYVAVPIDGVVYLGADRVPADFDMRVLETVQRVLPEEPPGRRDHYDRMRGTFAGQGVAYRLEPGHRVSDDADAITVGGGPALVGLSGCTDEGALRIVRGNETLAYWGSLAGEDADKAEKGLDLQEAEFELDGLGGACGHTAVRVHAYLRTSAPTED